MRFLRPGRLMIYLIIGLFIRKNITPHITLDQSITIKPGQAAMSVITEHLWRRDAQRIRWASRGNDELKKVQPGTYTFSGEYTTTQLIESLLAGPTSIYQRITLLEWWNIRDVDKKLTDEWLIEAGAYTKFVTDPTIIERYVLRYEFLAKAKSERGSLTTLEGYLYPETYMIDPTKDIIDQLVYLQLDTFQSRVRKTYGTQLSSLTTLLGQKWYKFTLSSYGALILASVIEKEERTEKNKPTIASVFFNRLDNDMKLDADITLCYGLREPYESCTPARIVQNLDDATNLFNTRAVKWLPPTPISSVQVSSVEALISAKKTDLFFYLHDSEGVLFTAKDITEHNLNKSKHLR